MLATAFGALAIASPVAAEPPGPPRWSIGGGTGFPGLVHADASAWMSRRLTLDVRAWAGEVSSGFGSHFLAGFDQALTLHAGGVRHAFLAHVGVAGLCGDSCGVASMFGAGWRYLGDCWDVRLVVTAYRERWFELDTELFPNITLSFMRRYPPSACDEPRGSRIPPATML
jgi:hypothetical protein